MTRVHSGVQRKWRHALTGLCALAGCASEAPDTPPATFEVSETREVLTNGLEVVVVPNRALPIATTRITFRAGAFSEGAAENGYSHLLEHMLFKGTESIPDPVEFEDRLGALGARWNAWTGIDGVSYFYVLPASQLDPGLSLLAQAILSPLIDADSLRTEIDVVLAEFDLDDSRWDTVQDQRVRKLLFPTYPSRVNPIGERDVIARATPEALRAMLETYYRPNNAQLLLVGDVEPQAGIELARQYFGDWERGPDPFAAHPIPEEPPLRHDVSETIQTPQDYAVLEVAYRGPGTRDNLAASIALDLLSEISRLTGQAFRRLAAPPVILGASLSHSAASREGLIAFKLAIGEGLEREAIESLGPLRDYMATITPAQISAAKDNLWIQRVQAVGTTFDLAYQMSYDWTLRPDGALRDYLDILYALDKADLEHVWSRYIDGQPRAAVLLSGSRNPPDDLSTELRSVW
jgi:zinc protease